MMLKIVTVTVSAEYYYTDSDIYPSEPIDERIKDGMYFDWSEEIQRTIVTKEIVDNDTNN